MKRPTRISVLVGCIFAVAIITILFWQLRRVHYTASASENAEFELACDYSQFRQIMVRKNATQAIVNHGGMELIESSIRQVKIDASKDDRPLLNAIRGISKTELDATKTITVRIANDQIAAQDLTLRQDIQVENDKLAVETESIGPQGDFQSYRSTLVATPVGNQTRVQLSVDMKINVTAPRLFSRTADSRVQSAAKQALGDQQTAITQLVAANAGKVIVLPDLKTSRN